GRRSPRLRGRNRTLATASRARIACAQTSAEEGEPRLTLMNCRECRVESIEFARSGASGSARSSAWTGHIEVCAECSAFFSIQRELNSALSSLAAESPSAPAPEDLEAKLLTEFDGARRTAPGWVRRRLPIRVAALAATLAAAVFLIYRPSPDASAGDEPFVQIPYVAPLAPYERTEVIRMDVPVAALIAAGFEVRVPDPGS